MNEPAGITDDVQTSMVKGALLTPEGRAGGVAALELVRDTFLAMPNQDELTTMGRVAALVQRKIDSVTAEDQT